MSTMKTRQDTEARSIAEQAAEWLLILEDDREEDHEAFADWLKQSPLHVGAFLRASAVDSLLSEVDPEKKIPLETGPLIEEPDIAPMDERATATLSAMAERRSVALASDAPGSEAPALAPVSALPTATAPGVGATHSRRRLSSPWALAAGVALVAIGAAAVFGVRQSSAGTWQHYVTSVGEQRAVELEDGSVVFLGPDSKVDVRFISDERQLRLESGQAVFRVHHDATRPFRVHTGRTVVQAVGTEFDVRRVRGDSVVSVIEGVVQVSHQRTLLQTLATPVGAATEVELKPVRVTAGQEIRVAGDGKAAAPAPAPIDHLQSWKERRLTFVNETLFTIADEFNRYNRAPKILIQDNAAGDLRYAAAFDADDPESLVAVLEKDPRLTIEQRADEIVIRAR